MTAPQRPASVPDDAWFVTDDDWFDTTDGKGWQLGETGPAGRTGRWRFWSPEGRLIEDVGFVDGRLDGQCRTFHDDGTVAFDNVWEAGRRRVVRKFRSQNPTAMGGLEGISETVWSTHAVFDDDGHEVQESLYDSEGRHVDKEGNPAPARPADVPATTALLLVPRRPRRRVVRTPGASMMVTEAAGPSTQRWVSYCWDCDAGRFRGTRIDWDTDGTLVAVGYHDDQGRLISIDRDEDDNESNPLVVAARRGDDAAVEVLIAHGAGASPYAAAHADFEGLHDLARRLRAADHPTDGIVDPREEPGRPELVPADAVWVPGLAGWLRLGLDDGTPTGTWTWWENDDNPWLVELRRRCRSPRGAGGAPLRRRSRGGPGGSRRRT